MPSAKLIRAETLSILPLPFTKDSQWTPPGLWGPRSNSALTRSDSDLKTSPDVTRTRRDRLPLSRSLGIQPQSSFVLSPRTDAHPGYALLIGLYNFWPNKNKYPLSNYTLTDSIGNSHQVYRLLKKLCFWLKWGVFYSPNKEILTVNNLSFMILKVLQM